MSAEAMQRAVFHVPGEKAAARAVILHQQVERDVFDKELGIVLQALLIERVQDRMSGPVGSGAGALRHLLTVADGLAAERALIDQALVRARERDAVMLQFQYGRNRLAAHIFDGVLVTEPVRSLDGVVHVELPIVTVAHIAERGRHAALCRHRVAARRKYLGDARRPQSGRGHAERGAHAGAAGADDHDVVNVLDDFIHLRHRDGPGHFRATVKTLAVARTSVTVALARRKGTRSTLPWPSYPFRFCRRSMAQWP